MANAILLKKPCALFDGGEVASAKPRRRSLFYTKTMFLAAGAAMMGLSVQGADSALAKRVAADFPGRSGAAFHHYAVPAMSEQQRLPDAYPTDGRADGTVNVVVARDEYENGAFLVWPNRDLGKVRLEIGDLKQVKVRGEGEERETEVVFPKEDLDLRVVKVWYQNRNAWFSYFGDTGLKLVPELLLHDDDLIRVDTKKVANYAKLVDKDGRKSEFWLNPPRDMSRRELNAPWVQVERFPSMRGDFNDAKTLQPVTLGKEAFRCFFLTVHAKKDAKPGVYRGEVEMKGEGGQRIGSIPVAIRVLDFALPQPKCWSHPEKDFLVSFYTCANFASILPLNGNDIAKAKRQLVNIFRNQVAHNQAVNWIGCNMSNDAYFTFDAMKEAGMRTDIHFSVFGPVYGDKDAADRPQRIADELDRRIGNHNSYVGHGDEPGAKWLEQTRPVYEAYQKAGLKFIIAGGDQVFNMAGYLYDWHNVAKDPTDDSSTRLWNGLQNDNHVAWYACQHVGSENPAFNRRQNGLAPYLAGYTALCNYEFGLGPWNDDSTTYRPMVYAYACGDGLVDTLQWEGFREGVDDIRYATLLSDFARKAQKSSDLAVRYLGGQAMQFLAGLDTMSCDQDMVRCEMIERIEKLRSLVAPYDVETSVVNDAAASKAGAARAEKNLAEQLAAAEAKMASAKNANETNAVYIAVADVYRKFFRFEEAGDYLMKVGLPQEAARSMGHGEAYQMMPEKKEAAHLAALRANAGNGGANGRAEAFWALLPKHPEVMGEYDDVFFHGIGETDTNGWRRAISGILDGLGRWRRYMPNQEFGASTALFKKTLPLVKKWNVTVPAAAARNLAEAFITLVDARGAIDVAKEGLKDEKAKPEEKAFLAFATRLADCPNDAKAAEKRAKEAAALLADVNAADRVKGLQILGAVFYGAGRENVVRGIESYRQSLYKPRPKKRYVVRFAEKPVTGITDMEKVEAESAVYDRSYGGDLEFLTTDVVTGDRGDVGSSKEKLEPPTMKVVADARGLHFLVTAKDPKAREIELGHVGGFSFEGYIAPGANTPYYCFLAEPLKGQLGIFNTSYDIAEYRYLGKSDIGMRVKSDVLVRDGEILTYIFFSWENWPTNIPKNGSVWDYENMYWNRTGNFCWNGTESIHGRSTWGELEFALTDAQRAAMLRPVIAHAIARYNGEKNIGGATALGHWQDATLGDLAFYTNSVAPIEKELDRLRGLFTPDVPDSTVFWLEREALPRWSNIKFDIMRLRAEHVRERLVK